MEITMLFVQTFESAFNTDNRAGDSTRAKETSESEQAYEQSKRIIGVDGVESLQFRLV